MKIAITATSCSNEGIVSEAFETAPYLLIIETGDMSAKVYQNSDEDGKAFAAVIIETGCEAVITGTIEQPAFDLLADAMVSRMKGTGFTVEKSLVLMDEYRLEFITDFNGGTGSHRREHEKSHGTCSGKHHEE
ncbi:MAG: hypothetical protein HGA22_12765 [Clostridiales bacterium]|nr:hypothetical protein [Clostridiales bacterium]